MLTLPVLDILRANYPGVRITVMVGPRPRDIFKDNPYVHEVIIYNKYAPLREKIRLFFRLKKERFDLIIDLRNTLFGALLPARFRNSPFLFMSSGIRHMKERNLYRLRMALRHKGPLLETKDRILFVNPEDKNYINSLLQRYGIAQKDKIVIVCPAAGGSTRRWEKDKFIQLCQRLAEHYTVALVGRKDDEALTRYIKTNCTGSVTAKTYNRTSRIFDFAGLTNLAQLIVLLQKSSLVVVCDTGVLHLASYLDVPIVALFGPSDELRYGPWSRKFKVITAALTCRPCRQPDCRFKTTECMREISVSKVFDSIDALLKSC